MSLLKTEYRGLRRVRSRDADEIFLLDDYLVPNIDSTAAIRFNNAGLARLSAAINAAGGGVVEFTPNATYWVGGAENQPRTSIVIHTYYNRGPTNQYLLHILNCSGVVLRGNGAKLKNAAGGFYGVFEDNDTATAPGNNSTTTSTFTPGVAPGMYYNGVAGGSAGYLGDGAATPYYAMIKFDGCSGVRVENLELDGNLANTNIGGPFSDTGIQLAMSGIDCHTSSRVALEDVVSHSHGLDGLHVDGSVDSEDDPREQCTALNCAFELNGRNGMSFVGGKGWTFENCKFNHSGRANRTSTTAGPVRSNPLSGCDFEAEGGKKNREVTFLNCEFLNNGNTSIVSDSGTPTDRISIKRSTLIASSGYSAYISRPGFHFEECVFGGTLYLPNRGFAIGDDPFRPLSAPQFTRCLFTDDVSYSPTGSLSLVNNLLIEGGDYYITFDRCTFLHTRAATGGFGNTDGPTCTDCVFIATAGLLALGARIRGTQSHFVESGGLVNVPNSLNAISGRNNAGYAEDSWLYTRTNITITVGSGGVGSYTISEAATLPEGSTIFVHAANGSVINTLTGSISGTTLTVTALTSGDTLAVGQKLTFRVRHAATIDKATGQPLGVTAQGNADVTLYPVRTGANEPSRVVQRFTAALTVDRTVTLPTTGARAGQRFRISRPAAGAFNLNVGPGPLKALAASQWCDVVFDGTSWQLEAAGSL